MEHPLNYSELGSTRGMLSDSKSNSEEPLPSEVPSRVISPSAGLVYKPNKQKKRSQNVRACDACAIRKVKCEARRPCRHCVINNLNCTQLRERKKSGPKKLHQKTIDSINHISDVKERPSLSNRSSTNTVTTDPPTDTRQEQLVVTPQLLINTLALLKEEPIVLEIIKPLTVQSFLIKHFGLTEFLTKNFEQGSQNDISLSIDMKDTRKISKALSILTLCLMILVNLEKLNTLKYSHFATIDHNPQLTDKDYLHQLETSFKDKIIDLLAIVDKNLIFPTNTDISDNLIYYNMSISTAHLYLYYQILRIDPYDSELRDQQKLINLRKSITYFQLIDFPHNDDGKMIQLFELYEFLYTIERSRLFFSTNISVLNNSSQLILNEWSVKEGNITNKFHRNVLFEIFNTLSNDKLLTNENIPKIVTLNSIHISKPNIPRNRKLNPYKYNDVKKRLLAISNGETYTEVLKSILLFKILFLDQKDLSLEFIKMEWIGIVARLNDLIDPQSEVLQIQVSNHHILPHLLQILLSIVEVEGDSSFENKELAIFTGNIARFFPFFVAINKVIRSNQKLNDWFLRNLSRAVGQENQPQEQKSRLLSFDGQNYGEEEIVNNNFVDNLLMELDNQSLLTRNKSYGNGLQRKSSTNLLNFNFDNNRMQAPTFPSLSPRNDDVLMTKGSMQFNNNPLVPPSYKNEEGPSSLALSESTKNLYNLFSQITDDISASTSNSFANLLQLNGGDDRQN